MNAMLTFQDVSFSYGRRSILRNATFRLDPGTSTALIGPNGGGKTTLLRLASGVVRPSRGHTLLEDRPLADLPVREAARLVAVVPQHLEIPFDLTVEQVVEQGRTPHLSLLGTVGRADRLAIDRALDLTSTSALRHRVFNELSGGERQRVKIALGLAQQPRLLLLDEPTQNLDIGRQSELMLLLSHLRETGLTILAAIHDLHLIPGNFAHVLLLQPSAAPQWGTPDEMLDPALLGTAFGCAPLHPAFLGQPQDPSDRRP